jgi:predicted deacetylase
VTSVDGPSPAILSIHDLMPETLPRVLSILSMLRDAGATPCTLLVVPGRGWTTTLIATLRGLEEEGFRLGAHGWVHRARRPSTLYHRLHASLISRDQGEHLSRRRDDLLALMLRSHAWFLEAGLGPPELYVPPAWAVGKIAPEDLGRLPFSTYETLTGLIHGPSGRRIRLPLVGFEADTRWRQRGLRLFNSMNLALTSASHRPLRISIHPYDLEHLLGQDLRALLRRPWSFLSEAQALERRDPQSGKDREQRRNAPPPVTEGGPLLPHPWM